MKLLLPVLLALIGIGAGSAAGYFLRPPAEPAGADAAQGGPKPENGAPAPPETQRGGASEYAKLEKQFLVPVIEDDQITAMVVAYLSLEMDAGQTAIVYKHEPKLRDAFNEILFLHSNAGGFSGSFTDISTMSGLRTALLNVAKTLLGPSVRAVLIESIMRQDT